LKTALWPGTIEEAHKTKEKKKVVQSRGSEFRCFGDGATYVKKRRERRQKNGHNLS